ncbi:MAG: late control protein, partial [Chryseobacterium sp.]
MFILKSEILIGDYIFRSVHDIEINKSVSELGDTAIIKMPRKFKVRQNNTEVFTENAIKAGDEVTIKLAYEGKYEGVEFKGYVRKVNTKIPLEIHCEDCIWLLRRKTITHNFGTTTLKKVLEEIVKDTPIQLSDKIPDMRLEKYLIKDRNGAQALQDIRENTGLSAFIDDDNNLYCGLIENTNIGQTAIYDLNY